MSSPTTCVSPVSVTIPLWSLALHQQRVARLPSGGSNRAFLRRKTRPRARHRTWSASFFRLIVVLINFMVRPMDAARGRPGRPCDGSRYPKPEPRTSTQVRTRRRALQRDSRPDRCGTRTGPADRSGDRCWVVQRWAGRVEIDRAGSAVPGRFVVVDHRRPRGTNNWIARVTKLRARRSSFLGVDHCGKDANRNGKSVIEGRPSRTYSRPRDSRPSTREGPHVFGIR